MNKDKLNIILISTIVILVLGFILVLFKVQELSKKKIVHDVVFSDVALASSVKGSTIDPTHNFVISEDKTEVNFNFGVNYTHDEIVYNVVIKNNGNVDLEGVFITIDYDSRISFSSFECVKEIYSYKNISGVKKTHVDYEYMSYVWKLTKKDNKLFFSMTRPLKVFESMDLYLFFDGPGKFNIPFNLSLVAGFNNTIVCNDTCFRYQKYHGWLWNGYDWYG